MLRQQYDYFEHLAPQIADIQQRYAARKRATNAMDFDDLLALWLKLLQEHEEVREQYQRRFQFILVDEYQDTNKLQSDLIDLLAARHQNVMVVGDDAQSIYAWRGANFQNILKFPERYPEAKVYKIETNYRSTPEILNVANAAITRQRAPVRQATGAGAQGGAEAGAGGVQRRGGAGGVRGPAGAGAARGRGGPEQDGGAVPLALPRAGTAARTDAAEHPVQHHQRHPLLRAGAHQGRDGVSEAGDESARRAGVQAAGAVAAGHRRQGRGEAVEGVSAGSPKAEAEVRRKAEARNPKPETSHAAAATSRSHEHATRNTHASASPSPLASRPARRRCRRRRRWPGRSSWRRWRNWKRRTCGTTRRR